MSNKEFIRAIERISKRCYARQISGKGCKGCPAWNTYPYGHCELSQMPAGWQISDIRKRAKIKNAPAAARAADKGKTQYTTL